MSPYSTIPSPSSSPPSPPRSKNLPHLALASLAFGLGIFTVALVSSGLSSVRPLSLEEGRGPTAPSDVCTAGTYSKTTLKPAVSIPFAGLFQDSRGAQKFEGSDVIFHEGFFYAIADSLWSILAVSEDLEVFGEKNRMIGHPFREDDESGYEGIFVVDGVFYVVRESVEDASGDGEYRAVVEEIVVDGGEGGGYTIMDQCETTFTFEGDSKGFEGAVGMKGADGELYFLGLCEGNHCGEKKEGRDRGHGRVVVMKKKGADEEEGCKWVDIGTMDIPSSANFMDYSAISISDEGRVAITSQEDSAMWVGELEGLDADGFFVPGETAFAAEGEVLNFPRDGECRFIYCNIEGIHWIGNDRLVAVSDKMKNRGKQDFRCFDFDQSLHIFSMP